MNNALFTKYYSLSTNHHPPATSIEHLASSKICIPNSQLQKKAIFYGIVGESGWFPQMLASRKTTAEYTKLAETVSICVNPRLISSCLSVFVAISFCAQKVGVIPCPESQCQSVYKVCKTNPIFSSIELL